MDLSYSLASPPSYLSVADTAMFGKLLSSLKMTGNSLLLSCSKNQNGVFQYQFLCSNDNFDIFTRENMFKQFLH